MPRVSVLMPMYNSSRYVHEAVASILCQTFPDFELIVVDDHSDDNSVEIVKSFNDPRIKLFINESNQKPGKTRYRCVRYASGYYLANLDSDDIAEPDRLKKQVDFLDNHPEVGVCGSFARIIHNGTIRKYELNDEMIKFRMFFDSPFLNSSAMFRKSVLDENNIEYDQDMELANDYKLWVDMCDFCKFANLPETLVNYRIHDAAVTSGFYGIQQKVADKCRLIMLGRTGLTFNEKEAGIHLTMLKLSSQPLPASSAVDIHEWMLKLIVGVESSGNFNAQIFKEYCEKLWLRYVNNFNFEDYNCKLYRTIRHSPFRKGYSFGTSNKFRLLVKCLIKWKNAGKG